MERTLTRFVRALRMAGAPVSPSEAIDAARTVALVGYGDRALLKNALAATLAKSAEERTTFDALFDLFFSVGDQGGAEATAGKQDAVSGGDRVEELVRLANGVDPDRLSALLERAAATAGADDIMLASQGAYLARRMLEELGIAELEERLAQHFDARTADAERHAEMLIAARAALQREARGVLARRYDVFGKSAGAAFLDDVAQKRAIDALTAHDVARLKRVVARMARRLADRHAQRLRRRRRGRLDLSRTLRAATGHDGVPFRVFWKMRRRERPKIVAVCDVSGSVSRYARFLLMILHALVEHVADLRTFAFSARLADIGDTLTAHEPDEAMERILRTHGAGATDYGAALVDLMSDHDGAIDRRTTVIVLGDGRSNHADPRLDLFRALAERARRIVWLCPEPESRWGQGDSCMPLYRPFCARMVHCATVADLEAAVDEILLVYG